MEKYNNSALWHPCTAMKTLSECPPLPVSHAQGSLIYLHDGRSLIDAISSWWCKPLGHRHPLVVQAINDQLQQYEHIIVPNTQQTNLEHVALQLAQLRPALNKIQFASDGSCAIDMAIKLAWHAKKILGQTMRSKVLTLKNAYHGETGLALSVSDIALYRTTYQPLLVPMPVLTHLPYVRNKYDSLWENCASHWATIEQALLIHAKELCAIIVEPIVQAAAGMHLHSADFLKRLHAFSRQQDIYFIADEIFTGLGRTGKMLACEHANITPDFLCLGKGLTAGSVAMSAMLTTQTIFDLFYVDSDPSRTFYHSHTFGGNALAAAAANATLQIMQTEQWCEQVCAQEPTWQMLWQEVADATGWLTNLRGIGAVLAADLHPSSITQAGLAIMRAGFNHGVFLRPLGNTVYWTPPLNTSAQTMLALRDGTIAAIRSALGVRHAALA